MLQRRHGPSETNESEEDAVSAPASPADTSLANNVFPRVGTPTELGGGRRGLGWARDGQYLGVFRVIEPNAEGHRAERHTVCACIGRNMDDLCKVLGKWKQSVLRLNE